MNDVISAGMREAFNAFAFNESSPNFCQNLPQPTLPSYDFLLEFYLTNVQHIQECKAYKRQLALDEDTTQQTPSFVEADYFKSYSGGHAQMMVSVKTKLSITF